MRKILILTLAAVLLFSATMVFVPSGAAATFIGSWKAIDPADGSKMKLSIYPGGKITFMDKHGPCKPLKTGQTMPLKGVGTYTVVGNTLNTSLHFQCLMVGSPCYSPRTYNWGNGTPTFVYNPANDTITGYLTTWVRQ